MCVRCELTVIEPFGQRLSALCCFHSTFLDLLRFLARAYHAFSEISAFYSLYQKCSLHVKKYCCTVRTLILKKIALNFTIQSARTVLEKLCSNKKTLVLTATKAPKPNSTVLGYSSSPFWRNKQGLRNFVISVTEGIAAVAVAHLTD